MIDQELRAPLEQFLQRGAAFVGLEPVRLVDPDPRQRLALPRQFVAAPGKLLFRLEQLAPRGQPVFTGCGWVVGHREAPFRRRPNRFSQGVHRTAVISKRYIGTIPLSGEACVPEQSISAVPPPEAAVNSAMTAKAGAAAKLSQSAAPLR